MELEAITYSILDGCNFTPEEIKNNSLLTYGDIELNMRKLNDSILNSRLYVQEKIELKVYKIENFDITKCKLNEGFVSDKEKWYLIKYSNDELNLSDIIDLGDDNFYISKYWNDEGLLVM